MGVPPPPGLAFCFIQLYILYKHLWRFGLGSDFTKAFINQVEEVHSSIHRSFLLMWRLRPDTFASASHCPAKYEPVFSSLSQTCTNSNTQCIGSLAHNYMIQEFNVFFSFRIAWSKLTALMRMWIPVIFFFFF